MLEYILDGGIMMYPLVLCSVVALAVIVDRWRAFRLAEVDTTELREEVLELLNEGKIDEAIGACERFRGPVAAVLMVGLHRFRKLAQMGRSPSEIETNVTKAMGDYVPHVMGVLEKRLWVLSMVASIAPLLGMTGTVTGMIRSFTAMAEMGGLEGNVVAAGISEALITTAAGLLIAMPAALFYHFFTRKVEQYVLDIEESGTKLIDFITLEHGLDKLAK